MKLAIITAAAVVASTLAVGCSRTRPLDADPVPPAEAARRLEPTAQKPLPADARDDSDPRCYSDPPLRNASPPPEAGPFVAAYNAVGRPKIVVYVNRTLEGAVVPTAQERVLSGRRRVVESSGPVDASRTRSTDRYDDSGDRYGGRSRGGSSEFEERFESDGPARLEDRTEIYLPAGEYDEIAAKRVDYAGLENALADALGVRGEVTILSPSVVRQRLGEGELAALQQGRPAVLGDLKERLGADVLVQVQARPTAQTDQGLVLAIVAEAMNTGDAQSIGRANATFDGPMSAARLDAVSRHLSRGLMDDMTGSWLGPVPPMQSPDATGQNPLQQPTPQQPDVTVTPAPGR